MPDLTAIAQALGAFKAMKDISQAMIGLRDASAFRERQIEFQQRIIDAQSAISLMQEEHSTLITKISDLEKELVRLETWDTDKQKYEMKQLTRKASNIAYTIKPNAQGSEPFHCICAACYQNIIISILQFLKVTVMGSNQHTLKCPVCMTEIQTESWPPPSR